MIDLSLSETQEIIKRAAHDFVEQEFPKTLLYEVNESPSGFSLDLWRKIAERGWVGMILPEAYGGGGSSFLDFAVIMEELGWAALPSPIFSSGVLCGLTIAEGGTERQKRQLLPSIAKGERILALALTEPDYGWGPETVKLTAKARDGKFVLNGTKRYIPDAHIADQCICVARTAQSADPQEGITLFLVDKAAKGLSCRDMSGGIPGVPKGEVVGAVIGEKWNELKFNSVEVDGSAVVGEVNKGWEVLAPVLEKATPVLCAYMIGGMERCRELAVEYIGVRETFGRTIGSYERIQDLIIDSVNVLDASRYATYEALWKIDAQKPGITKSVTLAKIVSSEGYRKVADYTSRCFGASGIDTRLPMYQYIKRSRSLYHYMGGPAALRKRMAHLVLDDPSRGPDQLRYT